LLGLGDEMKMCPLGDPISTLAKLRESGLPGRNKLKRPNLAISCFKKGQMATLA